MSSGIWVPPGGFVAAAQQTPAAQVEMGLRSRGTSNGVRKKRRAKKGKKAGMKKRKGGGRKLKFGSPAWRKKFMKKRKKK